MVVSKYGLKYKYVVSKYMTRREQHYRWKGGKVKTTQGYYAILRKHHPYAPKGGYVLEHRYIMELELGRYLLPGEEIDHINGIKTDNRLENLRVLTKGLHTQRHSKGNLHKRGKHIDTSNRSCNECKSNKTFIHIPTSSSIFKSPYPHWFHLPYDKVNWYCNNCYRRIKRRSLNGGNKS